MAAQSNAPLPTEDLITALLCRVDDLLNERARSFTGGQQRNACRVQSWPARIHARNPGRGRSQENDPDQYRDHS